MSEFRRLKIFEPPLVSWGIIAALLLLSAFVGLRAFQFFDPYGFTIPRWALALFGLLGMVTAATFALRQSMAVLLTLLVCTSAVIDLPISTGTSSPVNLTILMVIAIAGIWTLRMAVIEKRVQLVPSALNSPLLGFILIASLSWLASYAILDWRVTLPGNAIKVQLGQFMMFFLSSVAFLLTANHYLHEKYLKFWTYVIVSLGIIVVSFEIAGVWSNPLPAVWGSMRMWPFVLLAAHLLFNPDYAPKKWQMLGWAIIALWAYWFLSNAWVFDFKGGWVPAVLAIGLLVAIRWSKLSIFVGVVAISALVITGFWDEVIADELATGTGYRPLIWADVLRMTSGSWWLGLGPVNYMYYWPTLGVESLAYQDYVGKHPDLIYSLGLLLVIPSHNMYIDILAETGLLGLGLFLIFAFLTMRLGWRLAHRLPPGFLQAHTYGVLCGFAALLIGSFSFADWLIPFVYNITISGFRHSVYTWLLLGTLVSIEYSLKEKENEE